MTLKALRINNGYTQKQASKLLGISVDTLSNYERGKSFPCVKVIHKIEELYNAEYKTIKFFK